MPKFCLAFAKFSPVSLFPRSPNLAALQNRDFSAPFAKNDPVPFLPLRARRCCHKEGGHAGHISSHLHLLAGMFGAPEVFLLEFTAWQIPFGNISCHRDTSQTDNTVPPELLGSHRWHQGQEMSPGTDFSLLPAPREEFRVLLLQPGRGPAPNLCWGNLL